jgi:serine/threonine protein kinase
MKDPKLANRESLSLAAQERIDAFYLRYKKLCEAGETPPLEQFLEDLPPADREQLRHELLQIEARRRDQKRRLSDAEAHRLNTGTDPGGPPSPARLACLGDYRLGKVLGQGGMGIVYEAEDSWLRRMSALKLMKPEYLPMECARQRFLREARAMAALKSDHVVTVYQVGEVDGIPFVAMELLAGEPLDARLQRVGCLPWAQAARIGWEIADGLAAAHASGLIHRDIKPSNLWLETTIGSGDAPVGERVKILDFGLARVADTGEPLTQSGAVLGTPAYMAPEQASGQPVDARADLFSLGCVLYHLTAGRQPFDGHSAMAILSKVMTAEPTPLSELCPSLPPALTRLIELLLSKDPDRRPASAREVAAALQAIAGGATPAPLTPLVHHPADLAVTLLAAPPSGTDVLTGPTVPGTGRHKVVLAMLASVLALGLAAGGWFVGSRLLQPPLRQPLRGELIVRVWTDDRSKAGRQIGLDPQAVPVREDEKLHLEAKLNQPAYIYMLWIDGKGTVTGLYPWADEELDWKDITVPPPPQKPKATAHNPRKLTMGWEVDGTVGLDTILLLARNTPLPAEVRLTDVFGKVPPAPLGPRGEVVVRCLAQGEPVIDDKLHSDQNRRPKAQADLIDNQLLLLMDRLKDHFELIRAVQFAHVGK